MTVFMMWDVAVAELLPRKLAIFREKWSSNIFDGAASWVMSHELLFLSSRVTRVYTQISGPRCLRSKKIIPKNHFQTIYSKILFKTFIPKICSKKSFSKNKIYSKNLFQKIIFKQFIPKNHSSSLFQNNLYLKETKKKTFTFI